MTSRLNQRTFVKNVVVQSCEVIQTQIIRTDSNKIQRSGETQDEYTEPSEASECQSTDSESGDDCWTEDLTRYLRRKINQLKEYYASKPLPFKIILLSISFLILVTLLGLYMKYSSPPNVWKDDLNFILKKYPSLSQTDKSAILFTFNEILANEDVGTDGFLTKTILLSGQDADKLLWELQRFVKGFFNPEIREPIPLDKNTIRAQLHDTVESGINSSKHRPGVMGLMGIDRMQWDAPLVLHAFCDPDVNENSNRVNLLSMSRAATNKKTCEEQTLRVLTNKWTSTGGNADNIPPILSRIDFIICF